MWLMYGEWIVSGVSDMWGVHVMCVVYRDGWFEVLTDVRMWMV